MPKSSTEKMHLHPITLAFCRGQRHLEKPFLDDYFVASLPIFRFSCFFGVLMYAAFGLLDMLMDPGMNGLQTYTEIIKLYPGQKAVIVSGFSESDNVKTAWRLGVSKCIKKPYNIKELGLAVREVLVGPFPRSGTKE